MTLLEWFMAAVIVLQAVISGALRRKLEREASSHKRTQKEVTDWRKLAIERGERIGILRNAIESINRQIAGVQTEDIAYKGR